MHKINIKRSISREGNDNCKYVVIELRRHIKLLLFTSYFTTLKPVFSMYYVKYVLSCLYSDTRNKKDKPRVER